MQPDLHEVTVSHLLKELGLSPSASETESLADTKFSAHRGLVREFVSPHEAIAYWGCGARVHVDGAVHLFPEFLDPVVTELEREGNRHLVICSAAKSEQLIGLDGVARRGVEALTHTLTTILPLEHTQEVLLLVLPDDAPRVRVFSIAHRDAGLPTCCEMTCDPQSSRAPSLARLCEQVQRAHAAEVTQRKLNEELAQCSGEWQGCATDLSLRHAACRERVEEVITDVASGGRTAAELERLEQAMRELNLLAQVAREAAAEITRQSAEHASRLDGKRQAAALRRARLSRPLGAKALRHSRRSTEQRKRFSSAELEHAFAAVEADLLERTGSRHQGRDVVAVAVAAEARELARFEGLLAESGLPLTLGSLVDKEIGFEHARLARAREVGKADPKLALQVVEETRERLSLLRQLVDLARWLDADEVVDMRPDSDKLEDLLGIATKEASELSGLDGVVTRVLDSTTSDQLRLALRNFSAAYRLQRAGEHETTERL